MKNQEKKERKLRKKLEKQLNEIIEKIRNNNLLDENDMPINEEKILYFIELIKAMKKASINAKYECIAGIVACVENEDNPIGLYFISPVRYEGNIVYFDESSVFTRLEHAEAFKEDERTYSVLPMSEYLCEINIEINEDPCVLSREMDDDGYYDLISVFNVSEEDEQRDNENSSAYCDCVCYDYDIE